MRRRQGVTSQSPAARRPMEGEMKGEGKGEEKGKGKGNGKVKAKRATEPSSHGAKIWKSRREQALSHEPCG